MPPNPGIKRMAGAPAYAQQRWPPTVSEAMNTDHNRAPISRKSGRERFRDGAKELNFDLVSFWQWSASDLLSNTTRGIVAEYLVARALDADPEGVRDEWAAYDLRTKDGVKIEIKSAAYLQSWYQGRLSRISFVIPKTRAWDPSTNRLDDQPARQADVYVFALLAHQDKQTVQPLDVSQWVFYVLPTAVLDGRTRSQHSVTMPTLCKLCERSVGYHDLRAAVAEAAKRQREATATPPFQRPTTSPLNGIDVVRHR